MTPSKPSDSLLKSACVHTARRPVFFSRAAYSAALKPADADRAFERALEGNPDSFDVLHLYARHAFSAGQHAKSVELRLK